VHLSKFRVHLSKFRMKWFAFFLPLPGWLTRLREAKAGRNAWPVPGKPDKPMVVPFPIEWVPHRLELTGEDNDAAHARGFVFHAATCTDSEEEAAVGVAVSCCRCAVSLHPKAAHMIGGFDPPYCRRCRWVIKLLL
jgi:hypothetical protein